MSPSTFHSKEQESLKKATLNCRLLSILNFTCKHIAHLEEYLPFFVDNEKFDEFVEVQDKILAETALLLALVARIPDLNAEIKKIIDDIADIIEKFSRTERHQISLLRFPHLGVILGLPHVALNLLGRKDMVMQEIVMHAFDDRRVETNERIPYRALEARWVHLLINPTAPFVIDDLLVNSILMSPAHPISMSRADAYAITHNIMYATDFGRYPISSLLDLDGVRAKVDSALAWLLMTEDLDLIIELIYSATLLRSPWSPYVLAGWHFVLRTWDDLGFLPSPSFQPTEFSQLNGIAAEAYVFYHLYHTMYVAGLLCAALLSPKFHIITAQWASPAINTTRTIKKCEEVVERARKVYTNGVEFDIQKNQLPSGISTNSAQKRLINLLNSLIPTHRSYLSNAPELKEAENQVLADSAIIHSARNYDLVSLLKAIDEAMTLPFPISSTVVEALDFLARQQLANGAIGAHFVVPGNLNSPSAGHITNGIVDRLEIYIRALDSL